MRVGNLLDRAGYSARFHATRSNQGDAALAKWHQSTLIGSPGDSLLPKRQSDAAPIFIGSIEPRSQRPAQTVTPYYYDELSLRNNNRRPHTMTDSAKASDAPQSPSMNKVETAYAAYLKHLLDTGILIEFAFEPEKLRIGTGHTCTYTPDFRIVTNAQIIEFHEVKGGKISRTATGHKAYWREDARIKILAADAQHPYIFRAIHPIPLKRRVQGRHAIAEDAWSWETITPQVSSWLDLLDDLRFNAREPQ